MKSQFLIGAPASNSGKTTLTLGLLRTLAKRGLNVQPFKCGPDYIDPTHHTLAAGRPSINLDTFMMSERHVGSVYARHTTEADVAVVEGMMGLFDGAKKADGSSASIAALLEIPVVMILDARAMAYSVAPLLQGFKQFDPRVKLVGAIFNFVNSDGHYQYLKKACEDIDIEAFGYVPTSEALHIPSRHLGLAISPENNYETIIESIATHLAKTVDLDRLLLATRRSPKRADEKPVNPGESRLKIAVARDEAFNFTYHENLQALSRWGEVVYFSPLRDAVLPPADLVYLAGGYPELFLETLAKNTAMLGAIRHYCEAGGKLLAECGGLMYLGRSIIDKSACAYAMVGFLDLETSMVQSTLSLGYRKVTYQDQQYCGHEFHCSTLREGSPSTSAARVEDARGNGVAMKIYNRKNVWASYAHLYWGELDHPPFFQRGLQSSLLMQ